ncbi:MAG: oligoendopeptidase F [Chlamydiales bacterium]|nr:oligoendopeptidase F [Chlamydiales bacterium]
MTSSSTEQKKTRSREEIAQEDRWNVQALYASDKAWEEDMKKWGREEKKEGHWPEITAFKGHLAEGPEKLCSLFKTLFEIERVLSKIYTYAHLRHDEDVANDTYKKAYARISSLLFDLRQETSWIEPEILALPEEKLGQYLKAPALKEYHIYLEKIVRLKPHTLSAEKEELVALAGNALETASKAFGSFNNADLKFPHVEDSQGKKLELTHGKLSLYLRSQDRKLRKEAFQTLHKSYREYENTLCELINGQVQKHVFNMRSRKYKSCVEAALFPHQVDPEVYCSLIDTVRKNLGSIHRYMSLRKRILKYDELHMYDLHVPLVSEVSFSIDYPEAVDQIVKSVAPLGAEYQKALENGLKRDKWVDKYENLRKRSGAYSSGCYDSMPYILMNYQGTFQDLMTLAHEAGHSMHSFLSCKTQPYHDSQYPIFVAEVASTFNEELLSHDLLAKTKDKGLRAFLINQKIEDIRATFFRQTMFAEFELRLHQWAEEGVPLTPALLKAEYRKLNSDYFGKDLVIDEEIDIEWARIPHFYYNFYVYQYATGISAALALCERVLKEGGDTKERYLRFLSSGGSQYPLDLLKVAGVDMRKPDAVEATIRLFDSLVDELAKLI